MLSHLATTLALLRAQALISAASDQSCVCFARSSQYFPGDEKLLLPTDEAAHSRIIMFGISHRRPRPPPRPRLRQARRGSWLACQSRRRRREGGGHCHPRGARLAHRGHGLGRRGHVPTGLLGTPGGRRVEVAAVAAVHGGGTGGLGKSVSVPCVGQDCAVLLWMGGIHTCVTRRTRTCAVHRVDLEPHHSVWVRRSRVDVRGSRCVDSLVGDWSGR